MTLDRKEADALRFQFFSAHLKSPPLEHRHPLFTPICSIGRAEGGQYLSLETLLPGVNHARFNDMSHQYAVAKRFWHGEEYVGFEHYRRLFPFSQFVKPNHTLVKKALDEAKAFPPVGQLLVDRETFDEAWCCRRGASAEDIAELRNYISSFDLIVPCAVTDQTMFDQWVTCGQEARWLEALVPAIKHSEYFKKNPFAFSLNVERNYYCNMYIAKKSLFFEYISFWEDVMFGIDDYLPRPSRIPAFLSERLFSIFVMSKRNQDLKIAEIPYFLCQNLKPN